MTIREMVVMGLLQWLAGLILWSGPMAAGGLVAAGLHLASKPKPSKPKPHKPGKRGC